MGANSSIVDREHFDTNVQVGISAIFSHAEKQPDFLNSTEYSQFIQNNDMVDAGTNKQDFNG